MKCNYNNEIRVTWPRLPPLAPLRKCDFRTFGEFSMVKGFSRHKGYAGVMKSRPDQTQLPHKGQELNYCMACNILGWGQCVFVYRPAHRPRATPLFMGRKVGKPTRTGPFYVQLRRIHSGNSPFSPTKRAVWYKKYSYF